MHNYSLYPISSSSLKTTMSFTAGKEGKTAERSNGQHSEKRVRSPSLAFRTLRFLKNPQATGGKSKQHRHTHTDDVRADVVRNQTR